MSSQKVKLGDVCDVRDGTHESPKYVPNGYPLITSKNLANGSIDFTDVNYVSEEDYLNISKRSKVDFNDILMPMIGTIGNPVLVKEIEPKFAIKNVALIKFRKNSPNSNFIKLILEADEFKKFIDKQSRGGTQKFLSLGNIRNFEFELPSLEQQKRITAILEKANEIKGKRELALAKLNELEQNLFVELIHRSNKFGKEKLKTYLLKVNNCNPTKTYEDQEITYIDIGCIDNKLKKIINPKILDSANSPSRARQVLIKGDILVSTVRPNLNAVAQVEKDYLNLIGSTGFCVLRSGSNISDSFLFSVVKSKNFIKEMNKLATGASYPAVSDSIIMDYEIPVLPMDVQNDYAKKINSIKKITSHFISQIERMEKNISSLQNQAFTTGFNA